MTLSKKLTYVALTGSLLCASAVAETRFCLGGDLDHLSVAQRSSCSATLQSVRRVAATLGAPSDWHFVVVCGEEGWKQYAAFTSDQQTGLEAASADTNLSGHETFLREKDLQTGNPASVTSLVAHEVATIQLRSRDKQAVQSQVTKLLEQHRPAQGM